MKLLDARKSVLLQTGTYPACVQQATVAPGKKDPSSFNINITLGVITDTGRTVKVWDLLPDLDKNPAVFFRYEQYIQALGLELEPDFELNSRSFAALLNSNTADKWIQISLTINDGGGTYPPKNEVKKIEELEHDLVQLLKAERANTDTDAPAQPSIHSSIGAQSPDDEDPQAI